MKRPAVLIVGAVAGALIVAGVGASAHTVFFVNKSSGLNSAVSNDEASGARTEPTETPEPTDTPEAQATAEPTEQPETNDNDTETNDDDNKNPAPATSGEHDGGDHQGDHQGSGGDGGHGD